MTVEEALDACNPSFAWDAMRQVSMGALLAGLIPRLVQVTGAASSATHIHTTPGPILAVQDTAGTTNLLIVNGTAGAGEVQVTYDTDGLATLVFGDGANTAYDVIQMVLPSGLGATLAADSGSAV